jgi:glutathione S-transferase
MSPMTLTLYYHPLSSYSWKVLIPLYENATPFEPVMVDQTTHAAFVQVWSMGKFPVLVDAARGETVPESSAIIDYLDRYHPGPVRFIPADPDKAWRTRLWDRFIDLHIHDPVQKIVADRNRPAASKDPLGVEEAHAKLARAYRIAEAEAAGRTWLSGDEFGLADCAAAPALFYADKVHPFGPEQASTRAYLDRLMARPSFARVLGEAEPYFTCSRGPDEPGLAVEATRLRWFGSFLILTCKSMEIELCGSLPRGKSPSQRISASGPDCCPTPRSSFSTTATRFNSAASRRPANPVGATDWWRTCALIAVGSE